MTFGLLLVWLFSFKYMYYVNSLGCYKCSSTNNDEPWCDDPFYANQTYYVSDCWAPRSTGVPFPATQCIKVKVNDKDNGYNLIVRDCVTDDGSFTSSTEIGRMSHCGSFGTVVEFNGRKSGGCVEACTADACNRGQKGVISLSKLFVLGLLLSNIYLH